MCLIAQLTEKIKALSNININKKLDNFVLLPCSQISTAMIKISDRLQDIYRNPSNHMHSTKEEMYKCCMVEPYAISAELYDAHINTIPNPPWRGK